MPPVLSPEPVDMEPSTSPQLNQPSTDEATRSRGPLRFILVAVVVLAAIGFTVWKIQANLQDTAPTAGAGKKGSGSGDRAVPVTTVAVEKKTMPIYLTGLGTVTAYYSVTVRSRVDGQLMSVRVREGQHLRKGELLAEIDPGPYAAALAQAQGQLAKDKATANLAKVEAERYQKLYDAGVVSEDSKQTQAASAGQSEGVLQADLAAIQAAKVNVAYTRIASPIDGVVGLRLVDPGNIVHAADTTGLMLVTQLNPISVIFTLPEDELPQVEQTLAKKSSLAVEAYDRTQKIKLATGKLLTLDNQIDTTTGTDKVKSVFDNKDNSLFPNQFVNVRLILDEQADSIVIPASAVQTGSKGTFVYVVKKGDPPAKTDDSGGGKPEGSGGGGGHHGSHGDKSSAAKEGAPKLETTEKGSGEKAGDKGEEKKYYVEQRPITIQTTEGAEVIVASGLSEGEQVVIDGLEKLKAGSKVSPKKDGEKSGKSGKSGESDKGSDAGGDKDKAAKASDGAGSEHHHHDKSGDAGSGAGTGDGSGSGSGQHHHHDHSGNQL